MWPTRRALVVGLALLSSGCWLQPGFGPERQNWNWIESGLTQANVASLHQAWTVPTEGTGGEPLVTASAVYVGGTRTVSSTERYLTVLAVSRQSGTLLWRRDLPVDPTFGVGGVLSVANDQVLTVRGPGAPQSQFQTLDPGTGATIATATVSNLLDPATAAVGGNVVANRELSASSGANNLVVRSQTTLEVLWTAPIGSFSLGSNDPVLIAQGHIYLRDGEGPSSVIRVYPVEGCGAATCSPTSTFPVPAPESPLTITGAALRAVTLDGHLLLRRGSSDDRHTVRRDDLVALTGEGALAWTISMTDLSGVAAASDTVFAVGTDGATPAGSETLVVRSASSTWRSDGAFEPRAPVVAGGLVYVASVPRVHVYAADGCGAPTCSEITSVDLGPGLGGIYGMSVSGGMLFVNQAGPDGHLFAFEPAA